MRKTLIPSVLLLLASVGLAATHVQPIMSRVAFQLSNQAWVTTNSAKVNVSVNATLSKTSVAKAKDDILKRLQSLAAKASWHITRFNQSQDRSGLEQLNILAEARLPQSITAGMSKRVKALSKEGEKYSISSISYTPSLKEVERTRAHLRDKIYGQVKGEMTRLDKVSGQRYHVQSISFDQQILPMEPGPAMAMMMVRKVGGSNGVSMPIGNQMNMTASVILNARQGK